MTEKRFLRFLSPRLLVLALMLAAFVGLSFTKVSTTHAYICYAVETTDRYYSDAS
jgi:hypothetical protein